MKRFFAAVLILMFSTSLSVFAFSDVREGDWYYPYITDLTDRGIINGRPDGSFAPGASLTRAEFVKMLALASGDDLPDGKTGFEDVSESAWYAPYIAWAENRGVVLGHNGIFDHSGSISRQDMAVILVRYAESAGIELPRTEPAPSYADAPDIADYAAEAVYFLQKAGIMSGNTACEFRPKEPATRAEAAKIISAMLEI